MSLNRTQIANWLCRYGEIFITESDLLTGLDREAGDAGRGLNMHRGFSKVAERLSSIADKDINFILKNIGMALLSDVGGAGGPLSSAFFIHAAQVTQAHRSLALEELYQTMRDSAEGVISRGEAEPSGKAMYGVWLPVVRSPRQSCEQELSVQAALKVASQQAEAATQSAITMQVRKGRTSYPGERSIRYQGLGAASVMFMMQVLAQAPREQG